MAKIAINGLGRIGRLVFRNLLNGHSDVEIAAINDLTDPKAIAHLLKYDSVYGRYKKDVEATPDFLIVRDGKKEQKIPIFAQTDPLSLPWKKLKIDIVLECTGKFTKYDDAKKHIEAGAKKVLISAPSKDPDKVPSFLLGINYSQEEIKKYDIVDMGSCTTNCLAPVVKVLSENFGIKNGFMSTIHAYTNDQKILDFAHKDLRRARAAAINIIPTTTGAAKTIGKVIPSLKGKLDGIAFRVPTPTVSVVDLICVLDKEATAAEINGALEKASQSKPLKGILGFEKLPLVSSDFIASEYSSVVDSALTMANGNLAKVVAWYDNEWGYATRLSEFIGLAAKNI